MHSTPMHHGPGRPRISPALVAVVLFLLLAWPLILGGFVKGRGAADQLNYHEQAIRNFAAQWPHLEYGDYLSATTPGYHTVLAVFARYVADERWILQLVASLFTVALISLLGHGIHRSRRGDPGETGAARWAREFPLLLPLVVSMPVLYAGVWLLPDNAGWLGVLAILLLALRPRFDAVTLVAGAALLAALVFVRQIHIWPLGALLAAAWIGDRPGPDTGFDLAQDLRDLLCNMPASLTRVGLTLLAAIPATAILWGFWRTWGGLTPPMFHERHVGGNPSAPAFVLAVFGALSLFFLPFLANALHRLWVRHTWLLGLAALLGLAVALAAPTTYRIDEGRYSGLWNIAKLLPAPIDRSILITPLALLGAVLLAAWFVALGRRDRWIMLATLVAFTVAQCASFQLWQRYTEPLVLIWLALAAARVGPARTGALAGWRVVGPLALAAGLALVTATELRTSGPVKPRVLLAPGETEAPLLRGMVGSPPLGPGQRDDHQRNDRSD